MLKEIFVSLAQNYTADSDLINRLWNEIEQKYAGKGRYYHTLEHLTSLLKLLGEVRSEIKDWTVILFTLYYHDIIYKVHRSDNEERSTDFAENRMRLLAVPEPLISACKAQILATKKHLISTDNDTNHFTDADLSILGHDWAIYSNYAQNVRKEYAIYPDILYKPGRRKALSHFLQMPLIFKTAYFFERFELQARSNLKQELEQLQS